MIHGQRGSIKRQLITTLSGVFVLMLASCRSAAAPTAPPPPGIVNTAAPPSQTTAQATDHPQPTATIAATAEIAAEEGYWIESSTPFSLRDRIEPALQAAGLVEVSAPEEAIIQIAVNPDDTTTYQTEWVYALAVPFPTIIDDISWGAFRNYWLSGSLAGLESFGDAPQIVLTPDSFDLLTAMIGTSWQDIPITITDANALTQSAWDTRPAISIIPFDALTPEWKVLTVDASSLLSKSSDLSAYPLRVRVGIHTTSERGEQVAAGLVARGEWIETNRDPEKMTVMVLTGVTALVRATASQMKVSGVDFPANEIMPFLSDADILHTSNEVAFTPDCPPPEWEGDTRFCSGVENFQLLQNIGIDVIELTGNHVNDWGTDALIYSLALYDNAGVAYYGGGRDLDEALTPLIISAPDGTQIAFVGCNIAGPWFAYAGEENAGAAPCDDLAAMQSTIRQLKADESVDLVVVTLQYWERQRYAPTNEQIRDFALLADAGADIVSGSQAHQPQGFAFVGGKFIHYGVGNLFFDQMQTMGYRQMFADKHILYDGRHISTILFTGLMYYYSQPNPMPPEDRAVFLELIFEASGW